jgi:hypothetical protein
MKKPKYRPYSPNRFKIFTCGYAAEKLYVNPSAEVRDIETLPQARGSAVHEVLAKITVELAKKRTHFDEAELRTWTADAIRAHPASLEETRDILRMGRDYLLHPPDPLPEDAEVEQGLAVTFKDEGWVECDYDDPDAYVRGRVDIKFVSDDLSHATIIDHKTQRNIEDADTFQLGIYAWMMFKINPFLQEVRTVLYFAFYSAYREHIWRREELDEMEQVIRTEIEVCEGREDWSAQPHSGCQYCPFLTECPALAPLLQRDAEGNFRPSMSTVEILGNTHKAVQVAGWITVLRALDKAADRSLRAHVEFSGAPIAAGDQEFGFSVRRDVIDWDHLNKYQREEVYAIFKKYGVDPKDFMGFSQTHSKRIDRAENPKLSAELNAILKRKTVTEFRATKAKKPWPSFPEV